MMSKQNFNIWVYGDKADLKRGSGLFVPQEGVTFDHHFLLPEDGANFSFLEGSYSLSVFARQVGQRVATKLLTIRLSIGESQAKALSEPRTGIYFDYGPDHQSYHAHVQHRPRVAPEQERLLQLFRDKGAG